MQRSSQWAQHMPCIASWLLSMTLWLLAMATWFFGHMVFGIHQIVLSLSWRWLRAIKLLEACNERNIDKCHFSKLFCHIIFVPQRCNYWAWPHGYWPWRHGLWSHGLGHPLNHTPDSIIGSVAMAKLWMNDSHWMDEWVESLVEDEA